MNRGPAPGPADAPGCGNYHQHQLRVPGGVFAGGERLVEGAGASLGVVSVVSVLVAVVSDAVGAVLVFCDHEVPGAGVVEDGCRPVAGNPCPADAGFVADLASGAFIGDVGDPGV